MKLFDFHTHRQRHKADENTIEIISIHPDKGHEAVYYTLGYHPWWTHEALNEQCLASLSRIYTEDKHCLAIGECGLDKLKGPPTSIQIHILEQQLDIANKLSSPVVIHCVRQYHLLLSIKKNFPHISNWAIHGYARHGILAKTLLDAGFYLSVSPSTKGKPDFLQTISIIPSDRLFLETDSRLDIHIHDAYKEYAKIMHISQDSVSQVQESNFHSFFGSKWSNQNI